MDCVGNLQSYGRRRRASEGVRRNVTEVTTRAYFGGRPRIIQICSIFFEKKTQISQKTLRKSQKVKAKLSRSQEIMDSLSENLISYQQLLFPCGNHDFLCYLCNPKYLQFLITNCNFLEVACDFFVIFTITHSFHINL